MKLIFPIVVFLTVIGLAHGIGNQDLSNTQAKNPPCDPAIYTDCQQAS